MPITFIESRPNAKGRSRGLFRCHCGNEIEIIMKDFKSGHTQSCGCVRKEKVGLINRSHGLRGTVEYNSYTAAKQRCRNPKTENYPYYGGRGIEFRFKSFEEFHGHVGFKPSPDMSIDRIDVNGHYEIGNVRWATPEMQKANQR